MRRYFKHRFFIFLLYPLAVGYTPNQDSEWWLDILLGGGSLVDVVRDCSGDVIRVDYHPFIAGNIGVRYKHKHFTGAIHAGYLTVDEVHREIANLFLFDLSKFVFIAPYANRAHIVGQIGFQGEYLGIELGALTNVPHKGEELNILPSGTIRLGSEYGNALRLSFLDPAIIGTGTIIDVGFSSQITNSNMNIYYGIGMDAFAAWKLSLRGRFTNIEKTNSFLIGGSIGTAGGYGLPWSLSVGFNQKLR